MKVKIRVRYFVRNLSMGLSFLSHFRNVFFSFRKCESKTQSHRDSVQNNEHEFLRFKIPPLRIRNMWGIGLLQYDPWQSDRLCFCDFVKMKKIVVFWGILLELFVQNGIQFRTINRLSWYSWKNNLNYTFIQ